MARQLIAIMSFLPRPNAFRALQKPQHCQVKSLGSLPRFKLSSTLYRDGSNLTSSKFKSPCRSIGVSILASQGFFLSTRAQDIDILCRCLSAVPDCGFP